MKKTLILAAAAIAALSACTKEIEVTPINDSKAPVFTATLENAGTKTTLANGTKVNWVSNDEVKMVYSNSGRDSFFPVIYQATPGADATTATLSIKAGESLDPQGTGLFAAIYPASILLNSNTNTWILPATQMYEGDGKLTNVPMVYFNSDYQNTPIPSSLSFKNANAVLAVTVPYSELTSVKSITVSSNLAMNGTAIYDARTANLLISRVELTVTEENSKITLDCYTKAGQNVAIPEGGSKTFYIAIPPMNSSMTAFTRQATSYGYLQIEVTDGTKTKTMKTKEGTEISVVRNKIYSIAFADNQTPAGDANLLAGEFTVNSEGKKVKFTKGNLWCNTTTSPVTWAFETNQYDSPVGTDYTSDGTEDGTWLGTHVGHFYWTKDVANSYTRLYTYESISDEDHFFADGSDAAHNLSVAGTEGLYVLTQSEWNYLLEDSNTESPRYGLHKVGVTVAGKTNCLIIAPDGYTGTIASSYTAAEWATAEADGLVCLPAAGMRESCSVPTDGGSTGRYYASDYRIRYYQAYAYYFSFTSEDISSSTAELGRAFAIRLVKTVE